MNIQTMEGVDIDLGTKMTKIITENKKIRVTKLREILLKEGFNENAITAHIKELKTYGDIEFYPIMEVVDYTIIRNGGKSDGMD